MSLRFRLITLVCVALLISLALGGVIAYGNASRSVRTEMRSALLVGRQTVESALERLQNVVEPSPGLESLVASFKANRHLRVRVVGDAAAIATPTVERSPLGAVPRWFVRAVGVVPVVERVPVVLGGRDYGTVVIETDPHNEILEVWNEFTDSLVTPLVFCGLTIVLIYIFIGRALRPLDGLAAALEEIGDGHYRTRISDPLTPELARLRDSFNRMAGRLTEADAENRRLNEQLLQFQEEERSDLARDLHDEVSPFLFAINVDAATMARLLDEDRRAEARNQVHSITDAVRHMQRQVRHMLARLRPIGLAEFGLSEAIENIVAFWRRRLPEIRYEVTISRECEDLAELAATTICRIVQEALSNAVRHAVPNLITVSIDCEHGAQPGCDEVRIEVADDGRGMRGTDKLGYGLTGISERVRAIGGRLTLSNRAGGGFSVIAALPYQRRGEALRSRLQAAEP
jgi:two-component system sensor histidine kinase UhpB